MLLTAVNFHNTIIIVWENWMELLQRLILVNYVDRDAPTRHINNVDEYLIMGTAEFSTSCQPSSEFLHFLPQ